MIITIDKINVMRYCFFCVIRSFADKETEKVFNRYFSRKLPPDIQRAARRKLEILDAAEVLQDLCIPSSNQLEKLSGDGATSIVCVLTNGGVSVLSGTRATHIMR